MAAFRSIVAMAWILCAAGQVTAQNLGAYEISSEVASAEAPSATLEFGRQESFCQEPDQQPQDGYVVLRVADEIFPFRAADSFTYTSAHSVGAIRWYGAYQPIPSAAEECDFVDDFKVHIYEDDQGLPAATPMASYFPGDAVYKAQTGRTVYWELIDLDMPEIVYFLTLDPPFQAAAGQKYWVEIANKAVSDPVLCVWNWEVAPPGDGSCIWDWAGSWDEGDIFDFDVAVCFPEQADYDCNGNDIPDVCDLDCGPAGGFCDVPGCGRSFDVNSNDLPDECEELAEGVPAMSAAGLLVMSLTLLGGGVVLSRVRGRS